MPGSKYTLHIQSIEVQVAVKSLLKLVDVEKEKSNPKVIRRGQSALVVLHSYKPVCIEKYEDFRPLGRFFLREKGVTIAYGVITETNV